FVKRVKSLTVESLIREIENRFNGKSVDIMTFASHIDSFQSSIDIQTIQDTELKKCVIIFQCLMQKLYWQA
ncbi:Hypothetical protein CINCED_3A020655, partial [Cinara cedri]